MLSSWRFCISSWTTPPNTKLVLYNGVGLISIVLLLVGVYKNDARPKAPWIWFAIGLSSFLVADVIYYVLDAQHAGGPPFPNIADAFYLGMYPAMIVGLTKMVRHVVPGRDKASFIDAAVVGTAMFGILWVLFVDDCLRLRFDQPRPGPGRLAGLPGDGRRPPGGGRPAGGDRSTSATRRSPSSSPPSAALAVADTALPDLPPATGPSRTGLFIDAFWLTFYVGFALAALHPTVAPSQPPRQTGQSTA